MLLSSSSNSCRDCFQSFYPNALLKGKNQCFFSSAIRTIQEQSELSFKWESCEAHVLTVHLNFLAILPHCWKANQGLPWIKCTQTSAIFRYDHPSRSPVSWGCWIHWVHLCRGGKNSHQRVSSIWQKYLIVRLQSWSFGKYGQPFHCHCSQVLSDR